MTLSWQRVLSSVFIAAALSACSKDKEVASEPPIRPVKLFTVASGDGSAIRKFPGRIEASQQAELGFRVSGTVEELAVKEGDQVTEGQVLARLDATDFRITVEDRQATFDNANRNFARAKDLVAEGAISKLDYDRMEANFKTSRAALSAAKQNLAYTQLRAPFTGQIARRHIDNFEEIKAKQGVFSLQSINNLDVIIDLPESVIRNLRRTDDSVKRAKQGIPVYAEFEGKVDAKFPLKIKEIATRADRDTQTFQVRMTMLAPATFTVLPGMTANVTVDFSQFSNNAPVFLVPSSSVVSDQELDAQLWVLNPDNMTVKSRKITIGRMTGTMIEVKSGLTGNEEIISVGAAYLAEDMPVSRMIQTEQALPRSDDPS